MSFMYAFSGYDQIFMALEDQDKTTFFIEEGLFYYLVMPFGLKNAGATYQRLVNRIFRKNLSEAFIILRAHSMKLNSEKCAFSRGIKVNLEKICAILDMPPLRMIKYIQHLTGRVVTLNRFISRMADKCLPFFKALRTSFSWTEKCQKAFEKLKSHLTSPLLFMSLNFVYLETSNEIVVAVLVRVEGARQFLVYYGKEQRYAKMKKLIFSLIVVARKLCPYFQAHPITAVTSQPIKDMLSKADTLERITKYGIELAKFCIEYAPRTVVKS
ncbi:Retrovirus-related Pol polyprotein from transposon opus [Gossypium australe]|uniref:Retrovirus-related Pol polyprotein from transposon opus n=1 Tax=Gossypium australe TaxID=47621 RepID=A0A5B6VBE0_9ROSI|nr:Retrovirus-related Pol polyprotein from transposon opus [Gossypium australe]